MSDFSPQLFAGVVNYYISEPHASLLNGIIFGIPIKRDPILYEQLKIVGLVHLVVLSGTNITLLASLIASATLGFGKKVSCLITILIVILFIIFVRLQAPIVRAGFMSILTFVSIISGRKAIPLYLLFLSGILTILIWPAWLQTISFQLSYACTLGLIIFAQKPALLHKNTSQIYRVWQYVKSEFRTSMAAQIFSVPIIFFYFKQVSFISPIANILVSWLIGPLMVFGLCAAVLGKIHFALGVIPIYISYGLLSYMLFVIEVLSKIPYAFISF